ncbi:uncharacterized protein LOC132380394 [Hypanus sabinus]|uniref:uncharacterized protein LOC132380394 n=1 Tax=Hypanus sabinus TaxID=79690 RepID=UPI0028C3D186|nr:uncharacterized protein LOC132380394 [Hypanus sabinus]
MTDAASVHAVSLKLPGFWTQRPDLWFQQAEAQFHIRQITSEDTRYYYVVSSLDQDTAAQVAEFVQSPPADGKYTEFKALLLRTFGLSRRKRAARLLHLDGLGDRPPSALMNEMLSLADEHTPCLMFEQAFLEQLPEDIRLLLSDSDFSDPRKVAAWADLLWNAKKTTVRMVSNRFVWHGLCKQVSEWAGTCMHCQTAKVQRHTKAPPQQFHPAHRRFDHIHVDIVGPLPVSRGARYLLTIVDRFTRWPEAVPLTDTTSESCARALIATWISRFGVPAHITSDRGAQFTSSLWSAMASLLGTQLHHTTAYHPQSNGLVERFHRHLKSALMARLRGANWADELPWVLLGIRTAPKDDLHASSAELVYGAPLVVPGSSYQPQGGKRKNPLQSWADFARSSVTWPPYPLHSMGGTRPAYPKTYRTVSLCLYEGAGIGHRCSGHTRGRLWCSRTTGPRSCWTLGGRRRFSRWTASNRTMWTWRNRPSFRRLGAEADLPSRFWPRMWTLGGVSPVLGGGLCGDPFPSVSEPTHN